MCYFVVRQNHFEISFLLFSVIRHGFHSSLNRDEIEELIEIQVEYHYIRKQSRER